MNSEISTPVPRKIPKDIPVLVCLLITLPIAAADWVRLGWPSFGNTGFTTGQMMGHALIALILAGLISVFTKMRFRLTWVATFAAVVLAISLPSLILLGSADAQETNSSGPLIAPTLAWPQGWSPPTSTPMPSVGGVQQTVILTENGRRTAAIFLQLSRQSREAPLAEQAKGMIEGESKVIMKAGAYWTFTTPTEITWLGRPALQYDAILQAGTRVRQRIVLTKGSALVVCSMMYVAPDADFEKHVPEFEKMKSQFVCAG